MARPAPAASRAAEILLFLTAHPARGFRLSELVDRLGMNVASAHATLAVLADVGLVDRDPVHRTYVLGPAVAAVGFAALEQHPAVGEAIAEAEVLAGELHAEAIVTALAGRDAMFLARRGAHHVADRLGYPGDRSPLLAPFGAVFVAWADDRAIGAWLERAGADPVAAERYRRVLAEIRDRGYSVGLPAMGADAVRGALEARRDVPSNLAAEDELAQVVHDTGDGMFLLAGPASADAVRISAVTAPIFDRDGRVLLALSVASPAQDLTAAEIAGLGRRVADAATLVTRRTRGRRPDAATAHRRRA
jgi:DNA-binding IclR family transcriptional regulator